MMQTRSRFRLAAARPWRDGSIFSKSRLLLLSFLLPKASFKNFTEYFFFLLTIRGIMIHRIKTTDCM